MDVADLSEVAFLDEEGELTPALVDAFAAMVALDRPEARDELSAADLVELTAAFARVEAYAASGMRRAAAALERRSDLQERLIAVRDENADRENGRSAITPPRLRTFRLSETASDELSARLGISRPAARRLIAEGRALDGPACLVGDAMTNGEISAEKARILTDALHEQPLATHLAVADEILPAAGGVQPAELARRVECLVIAADPARAAARAERARCQRNLSPVRSLPGGMARITLTSGVPEVAAFRTAADLAAKAAKAQGDARSMDQLRADAATTFALTALANGALPSLPGAETSSAFGRQPRTLDAAVSVPNGPQLVGASSADESRPARATSEDVPRPARATSAGEPRPARATSEDVPRPARATSEDVPRPARATSEDEPRPARATSADEPRPIVATGSGAGHRESAAGQGRADLPGFTPVAPAAVRTIDPEPPFSAGAAAVGSTPPASDPAAATRPDDPAALLMQKACVPPGYWEQFERIALAVRFNAKRARTLLVNEELLNACQDSPLPVGSAQAWTDELAGAADADPSIAGLFSAAPAPASTVTPATASTVTPATASTAAPATASTGASEVCAADDEDAGARAGPSPAHRLGWQVPELVGVGPLDHAVARRLALHPPPWLNVITLAPPGDTAAAVALAPDPGSGPAEQAEQYVPSLRLRAAVVAAYPTCVGPTCHVPAPGCQLDHVLPWPVGATELANLRPLCQRCHLLKTHGGHRYTIDPGTDEVTWTTATGHTYRRTPTGATRHVPRSRRPGRTRST